MSSCRYQSCLDSRPPRRACPFPLLKGCSKIAVYGSVDCIISGSSQWASCRARTSDGFRKTFLGGLVKVVRRLAAGCRPPPLPTHCIPYCHIRVAPGLVKTRLRLERVGQLGVWVAKQYVTLYLWLDFDRTPGTQRHMDLQWRSSWIVYVVARCICEGERICAEWPCTIWLRM